MLNYEVGKWYETTARYVGNSLLYLPKGKGLHFKCIRVHSGACVTTNLVWHTGTVETLIGKDHLRHGGVILSEIQDD